MAAVNPITKEILVKIVYYGPGLGGKTTTLEHIHKTAKPEHRGKMISLSTPVDRTLYFDFLPIRLPKIGDYTFRLQLFTVPGQVHYNATRKLVLTGADGVVMVADSQLSRMDANIESFENLRDNLAEQKISLDTIPLSFQFNKRDIDDIATIEQLNNILNQQDDFSIGTCAITGDGVFEGLQAITKIVLRDLKQKEILIQDDGESSRQFENKIAFKKEDQGILNSVQEFSESSSTRYVAPTDPDELTATYEVAMEDDLEDDKTIVDDNQVGEWVSDPMLTPTVRSSDMDIHDDSSDFDLTFASLFPVMERNRVLEIESAIKKGRDHDAIRTIWSGIKHYLKVASAGLPNKTEEDVVQLLGLDGRRYLEVARTAHSCAEGDSLPQAKLLKAYLFLLQIVISI